MSKKSQRNQRNREYDYGDDWFDAEEYARKKRNARKDSTFRDKRAEKYAVLDEYMQPEDN